MTRTTPASPAQNLRSAQLSSKSRCLKIPDYEVLGELGRGGMGVVFKARHRELGRLEVIKVMNDQQMAKPGALERFRQEIRSASQLHHPNIVTVYSFIRTDEIIAYSMEFVDGEDLATVVKARGPLPVSKACYYIHQAALGLKHAHERGLVHRDIKPANLILAKDGKRHRVKILDFGIAKATRGTEPDAALTGDDVSMGTPAYMAPEQALDAAKADIRSDLYSLGCTLYHVLAGRPPFIAPTPFALFQAHQVQDVIPLTRVRGDVSEGLSAIITRLLAKKPEGRFQTPQDVADALAPYFMPVRAAEGTPHVPLAVSDTAPQTVPNDAGRPLTRSGLDTNDSEIRGALQNTSDARRDVTIQTDESNFSHRRRRAFRHEALATLAVIGILTVTLGIAIARKSAGTGSPVLTDGSNISDKERIRSSDTTSTHGSESTHANSISRSSTETADAGPKRTTEREVLPPGTEVIVIMAPDTKRESIPTLPTIATDKPADPKTVVPKTIVPTNPGTPEWFVTVDGAKLNSLFFRGNPDRKKNNSCVLLIHPYMAVNPQNGAMVSLANALATEGYHVLSFTFRGHGTAPTEVVTNEFWTYGYNKNTTFGSGKSSFGGSFVIRSVKGDGKEYFPHLVNDLLAARLFLDQKNDLGILNSSAIYLVGFGDAVNLGFLYAAAEWHRESVRPNLSSASEQRMLVPGRVLLSSPVAGQDLAGAVWISPAKAPAVSDAALKTLTSKFAPRLRNETPMLFLNDKLDLKGQATSAFFLNDVLVNNPKPGSKLTPLENSYQQEINRGDAKNPLVSMELLNKNLGTEESVIRYLDRLHERKSRAPIVPRGYKNPKMMFNPQSYGIGN